VLAGLYGLAPVAAAAPAGRAAAATSSIDDVNDVLLSVSPAANDWSCRPSARHPFPVILMHGLYGIPAVEFLTLAPRLKDEGYCVFTFSHGGGGLAPLEQSAAELGDFVDHVLEVTGARKVAIVGYSTGGVAPRYYMRYFDGADKVDELVAIAPPNHGTWFPLELGNVGGLCPACEQASREDSEFLHSVNKCGGLECGVDYTVVSTRLDEVVTPYRSQFLDGPPHKVSNVTVQDLCPLDLNEHMTIPFDTVAHDVVSDALSHPGPARLGG